MVLIHGTPQSIHLNLDFFIEKKIGTEVKDFIRSRHFLLSRETSMGGDTLSEISILIVPKIQVSGFFPGHKKQQLKISAWKMWISPEFRMLGH